MTTDLIDVRISREDAEHAALHWHGSPSSSATHFRFSEACREALRSHPQADALEASGAGRDVDAPSAWRIQQVLDSMDEVLTRWPDERNADCHLILTREVRRLRELCQAAVAACGTPGGETEDGKRLDRLADLLLPGDVVTLKREEWQEGATVDVSVESANHFYASEPMASTLDALRASLDAAQAAAPFPAPTPSTTANNDHHK